MKINNRIENVFATAAALGNCGRFKSNIYCIKNHIYILNSDNTVLLRFNLRDRESPFSSNYCFSSSDYDGRQFSEQFGKIIFSSDNENYERKKIIGNKTELDVEELWLKFPEINGEILSLDRSLVELLGSDLSHVELSIESGKFYLRQRDIYSGNIIEISYKEKGLALNSSFVNIENFGPIGLRTNDFMALFSFQKAINLVIEEGRDYCCIDSPSNLFPMKGIIAHCLYDELGTIEEVNTNGRKKPENRRSQPQTDPKVGKSATEKKTTVRKAVRRIR